MNMEMSVGKGMLWNLIYLKALGFSLCLGNNQRKYSLYW